MEQGNNSAVEARRFSKAQPENRREGDAHPYQPPADRNVQPGVGNLALMIGNWGMRPEKTKGSQATHDRQILGSPAMIIVLFEDGRRRGYATTAAAFCR